MFVILFELFYYKKQQFKKSQLQAKNIKQYVLLYSSVGHEVCFIRQTKYFINWLIGY